MYSFHRHSDDKEISFTGFTFNEMLTALRILNESGDIRNDDEECTHYFDAETGRTQQL